LRKQIPIRTEHWDVSGPGYIKAVQGLKDLVDSANCRGAVEERIAELDPTISTGRSY